MPRLKTSTYHLPQEEYAEFTVLADQVGCSQSRLARVALSRLGDAPVDELREEAKALTDYRSGPRCRDHVREVV